MSKRIRIGRFVAVAVALLALSAFMLMPASAQAQKARSLGLENPTKNMNVHVMLNLRNEGELQSVIKDIQDKNSPNYHKYLTKQEFAARFAPTAADSAKIVAYLKSQGLTVTHIDSHNLAVSATGSVSALQKAFSTQIEKIQGNAQTANRPTVQPSVPPSIAPLVKSISGLNSIKAHSYTARQVTFKNKKAIPIDPVKYSKTKKNGLFFPGDCFSVGNDVLNLVGLGLQGIYSGNAWPDAGCGYSPAEMQHAYGFDSVIQAGWDGTGEYVTIVDPYGSYTILQDANIFSSTYGLPALVANTNFFQINNPLGVTPDCVTGPGVPCGWEIETTLDVEWAHAMAPGAKIILVTPGTANFDELAQVDYYIATNLPTGSVSHSFGFPEWLLGVYYGDAIDISTQYAINNIAANVLGVSNNYSTGDDGDYYTLGASLVYDVSFPSGSPDATAVGGTSLALTSAGAYKWENGWGTNITLLGYVPPFNIGFYFGGGGGTSAYGTPAPAWQQAYLNNTYRQQPDVSLDGDPYTGAELIYTDYWDPGNITYVTVEGGTSLSCPMFSAIWSIAEQKAGNPYLGNAAPYVYYLNQNFPGSVRDVQPVGSGHNAHGTIFCSGIPCYNESQWDLAYPYQNSQTFYESIYNAYPYSLTFGTDSSLYTAPGWDNVTGVGTPNGWNFIGPF